MKLERLTEKAQDALQAAAREAQERGQQAIEPDHLLLELVRQEGGIARPLLEAAGASIPGLEAALVSRVERLPRVSGAAQPYLSSELVRILDQAEKQAEQLKDDYVSTEHILLAATEHPVLAEFGVRRDSLLQALRRVRGSQRVTDPNPESKHQALERYGRDLTELAAAGKLDPVIGRDEEIRRVIQVLSRRTKNNPVLIGEPGVGKTAIAEGLAQRIAAGDVPEGLKNKRGVVLDGELESHRDVELAISVAGSVPGVASVDSRLRARSRPHPRRPPSPSPEPRLVMIVPGEPCPPWRYAG